MPSVREAASLVLTEEQAEGDFTAAAELVAASAAVRALVADWAGAAGEVAACVLDYVGHSPRLAQVRQHLVLDFVLRVLKR